MRNFVRDYISDVEMYNASLEGIVDDNVSNEGIALQLAGAAKDNLLLVELRDSLKTYGWTGWDVKRVLSGIDSMETAINNFVDGYIDNHNLKGVKVPYDALDSTIAWRDQRLTALFLIDQNRFNKLLKSVKDGSNVPIFGETVIDLAVEVFNATEIRSIVKKEIKEYDDFKKLFSKACENCRTLILAAVNENTGKLPKAFFANHFVGLNGLVAVASQVRSAVRRAV